MKITGIDHIDISVKDVSRTVQILEILGFEVVGRNDHHAGTVEMKLPGPNQPVFDVHPAVEEHLNGETGVVHIAFGVDDAQKAFAEMKSKGIKFDDATHVHPVKSTKRILFSISGSSPDADAVGTCYLQFVDPNKPATT